jgi:sugar phosphate isomerase/epimerase
MPFSSPAASLPAPELIAMLTRRQLLGNVVKAAGFGAAASFLPLRVCEAQGEDTAKTLQFKYAICNELFGDWPFEKAFGFAAECGYQGVEIAPFTLGKDPTKTTAVERAEVRKQAEAAGLKVVGLHWLLAKTEGFHLTSPDAAVRRKTAEYFGDLARLCTDLGGRIMVLGSPKQRDLAAGMSKQQGMKFAADVLQAAAPTCEKTGVVIAIEPLAPAETNFLTSAAEGAELVNLVDSPTCRLHLDCKAMAAEKGSGPISRNGPKGASQKLDLTPFPLIPDLIHKYRKLFVHFHANDPNRQGPGFGKLDFVPIMKALAEVGYRGWVSVEPLDYTPGAERLARESIRYLRKSAEARKG